MKQVLEFVPIVVFFIVYNLTGKTIDFGFWQHEFNGLFSATGAMLIATFIQVVLLLAFYKKLEKREFITIGAVIALCTLTLVFHNGLFIIWKPTIFNWILAIVFLAAPWVTGKTLVERIMAASITLPAAIWRRLNFAWVAHFTIVGALNLYIAYSFSEKTWVSYKMYSSIGFTIFLLIFTIAIVAPYIKQQSTKDTQE